MDAQETDPNYLLQKKFYLPAMIFSFACILIVALMPLFGEVGMANEKTATMVGLWVNFLGKFHPLFLHLPIGALMLVFLMEGAGLVTCGRYRPNTTLGLFFAALTGVFAVVFGYCLYLTGEYPESPLVLEHKRDGILFSLFLLIAFMVKYTADVKVKGKPFKGVYFASLGATGILMMCAGHHGGEISHGDPIDSYPVTVMAKRNERQNAPVVTDPVVYTHFVHPILEAKCISCHGEDKQKGALRLDSYAFMLEGGEETACLVPGDVKESSLVTYLHLPENDDLHMPPEGKTQMTEEEIQILEWWVKVGAPESAKRSELEITPVIEKALATLLTSAQREKLELAEKTELAKKKKAYEKKRVELAQALDVVNAKFPGSLKYVSQQNSDLNFSAVSYRSQFTDADIDVLTPVFKDVVELDLSSTQITDVVTSKLSQFINLKKIKLNGTQITDVTLVTLSELPNLEVINVYGTQVSDQGISALAAHPRLHRIYVWDTKVSEKGAKLLENALRKRVRTDKESHVDTELPQVILGMDTAMNS
ncbi:MAG: c-type cytochrome domain-containing protein [Rubritalea sp.]|uniref:c-type cytochrome domain-containing protein n=1 Tax=Rubritalea sp. TaxID=2109375 RepID=UPI003242DE70